MSKPMTAEQSRVASWLAGPLLVLSVAGSGKTFTILRLVLRWLASGVPGRDIKVCTFNTRAAADFKRRAAEVGIPSNVDIRTLNSLGWSIIGEVSRAPSKNIKHQDRRDPVLMDARSSDRKDAGIPGWRVRKVVRETLQEWRDRVGPDNVPKAALVFSEIGRAKAALVWPEEWAAKDGEQFPAYREWAVNREREPVLPREADIVADAYERLEAVMARPEDHDIPSPKNRMYPRPLFSGGRNDRTPRAKVRGFSFDDQIAWPARWILEGRFKLLEGFRNLVGRMVVDEAQDDNRAQDVLARFLARDDEEGRPNLVMVGDDQQSIYAFRGARPELLADFRDTCGATVLQLSNNFRCAQRILDTGNAILAHADDRLFDGELLLGRTDDVAKGGTVTATQYHDVTEEAEGVADGIAEAIQNGVNPDEIAVLFRLNAQTGPVEVELIKRGIRYKVAGSSFFQRAEVKAALAWLSLASNACDDCPDTFRRAATKPNRGLGQSFFKSHATLTEAREAFETNRRGLYRGWSKGLGEFFPLLRSVREFIDDGQLLEAVQYVAGEVGVAKFFRDDSASDEDETDVDINLAALASCVDALGSLDAVLEMASDDDTGKSDSTGDRMPAPRVNLSTIHKAKGLEWEYVALPGWSAGLFPFFRAPEEEERRLAYVAVTRARQHCHISWTEVNVKGEACGPSSFVDESRCRDVAEQCGPPAWPETRYVVGDSAEAPNVDDLDWSDED